jgi:phosphoglycolate phosphatase-like HAD superfamily hydrolase
MKLVLFDIDGTLIYHIDLSRKIGFPRFENAIKKVYGIDVHFSDTGGYNGWTDKQIIRSIIPEALFPQKLFEARFLEMGDALVACADIQASDGKKMYGMISDAVTLATRLQKDSRYTLGILTGNVEKMAWWKLRHVGIPMMFPFGLFGDTSDDRIALSKSVFDAVWKKFHTHIQSEDITIIGDTIHDIRCGKAIGAKTIGVSTGILKHNEGIHGGTNYIDNLKKEQPDFLVDSLMDPSILEYFFGKNISHSA